MEETKPNLTLKSKKALPAVIFIALISLSIWGIYSVEKASPSDHAAFSSVTEPVYRGTSETKRIDFPNGDFFEIKSLTPDSGPQWLSHSVFIPGKNIEVASVNGNQEFMSIENTEDLPLQTLFIQTTQCDAVISICAAYNDDKVHNIRIPIQEKERPLRIRTVTSPEPGYVFTGGCALEKGESTHLWYLLSRDKTKPLFDFDNKYLAKSWGVNSMDDSRARLCTDGYYFELMSNYLPYKEGSLFRMPACYAGASFVRYPMSRVGSEVGYAMLRLSAATQNENGYWETGPYSLWLESDFDIGSGFYDTRFNTEFASALVDAYPIYHDKTLLEALIRYTEYFINHAKHDHINVGSGWLVRDYAPYNKNISYKQTHSSLNHQLAETLFLMKLDNMLRAADPKEIRGFGKYDFVRNPQIITNLTERLLCGIENSAEYWIMEDHNLKYSYGYEGSVELTDYPSLTYNDLYDLNKYIEGNTGETNEKLEMLMAEKKQWMDANGVTDYRKPEGEEKTDNSETQETQNNTVT